MNKLAFVFVLAALFGCSDGKRASGRAAAEALAAHRPDAMHSLHGPAYPGASPTPLQERIRSLRSFARLADRGELVSYAARSGTAPAGRSVHVEGAYTWHRVEVSEEHALRGIVDGHLRIPAPSGRILDFRYDYHVEHPTGDLTWAGYLQDQPGIRTVLTFGAEAVFGRIGQPGQRALRLTVRDGTAWLVETDPMKLAAVAGSPSRLRDTDALAVPARRKLSEMVAARSTGQSTVDAPIATTATAAAGAVTTIDLLVGYTQGFVDGQPGGTTSAALTRINAMVAIANDAFSESQTGTRIRLVHAMQVSYTDRSTNDSTLEQLTGYDAEAQDVIPPDAAFNALRAARESYGADLVTLVRRFQEPEQDGCGIAWLIGGGRQGVTPNDGQDYFGYSVVSDGYDGNYFCREETLAHEVAHNMGSQHDRETAKGEDGVLDAEEYGAYSYSFGMKASAGAGNFYTIMAYGDEGQQDYPFFSTPLLTCGSWACGATESADNSRSLAQLAPAIANFRRSLRFAFSRNDFNGDGMGDILWRNFGSSTNVLWLSADSEEARAVTSLNSSWFVAGTGDFDGDGRADALWRRPSSGANIVWFSANAETRRAMPSLDATWSVAAAADFDGDQNTDIVWRSSSGVAVIWLKMDGSRRRWLSPLDSSWAIVGAADFDADGRDDLVWRRASTGANVIWHGGDSSDRTILASADSSWQVASADDFDGDGRADIVWRKPSAGTNLIWYGAKATSRASLAAVDSSWRVVETADFDADGRSDLLWRRTTGANVVWYSANASSRRSVSAMAYPSWSVSSP